jgi:signal transduction histidine kinase
LVESKGSTNIEAIYKDIRLKKELERNLINRKNYLEEIVKERTFDLEKQKKILLLKNKKLLELTEKCNKGQLELKAFFNAITDTIIVVDPDFNITMSNKKEIGNKGKCYEKLFKRESICNDCPAIESFKTAEPKTTEVKFDGQYYLLNTYPILNNEGHVDKIIEICANITTQKQMEFQLLQSYKLASLGKLVAGVAHEINNPNTFIRGNIKIIKESFNDIFPILDGYFEDYKDLTIARLKYDIFKENIPILIDDMVNGTNRIKKIVDGLRNYAKKDEGLLSDNIQINHVVNNSLRLVENQIRRCASVKLDLDPNIPKFKGNIQKMEQVIVNLLVNASQAIENGFGKIEVKTRFNEELNHIMIKIKDNGKGMDEKTKKSIFDPFFTTKRDKGGTGLGLSISFRIIKEHFGRIEVDSKLNHGTTFRIYIPIKTMEQKKEEQ